MPIFEDEEYTEENLAHGKLRAINSIGRQEDVEIFKVINAAVPSNHSISSNGTIQPENLTLAFALIESHELTPATIVMHPMRFADMRNWNHPRFEEYSKEWQKENGFRAEFMDVKVYTSTMCPKNAVYVMPANEYVGILVEFSDIDEMPVSEKDYSGVGIVKTIGVGVINDYSIVRIISGEYNNDGTTTYMRNY